MNPPASSLKVIRAEIWHAELIAPLFDAYRQFYGQPSDYSAAHRFITERLKASESVVFLATLESIVGSKPVGFVQLYPAFSSISMKRIWILNDLFVAPEARKRGVGAALMESARQLAVSTASKELILETAIDNLSAQRLYEKLGYKRDVDFHRYALSV
ncbi:MAG TPA: GNAT family N-acetyltransferase [Terriglobia bacterium]|nr:GNAT family N-acetyltransferase [Terriglobia bacterium]